VCFSRDLFWKSASGALFSRTSGASFWGLSRNLDTQGLGGALLSLLARISGARSWGSCPENGTPRALKTDFFPIFSHLKLLASELECLDALASELALGEKRRCSASTSRKGASQQRLRGKTGSRGCKRPGAPYKFAPLEDLGLCWVRKVGGGADFLGAVLLVLPIFSHLLDENAQKPCQHRAPDFHAKLSGAKK